MYVRTYTLYINKNTGIIEKNIQKTSYVRTFTIESILHQLVSRLASTIVGAR